MIRVHDVLCPRYMNSCECDRCHPPQCLCDLIEAVKRGTSEDLRIAFYAAAEEANR